jgi:hypothetical protein
MKYEWTIGIKLPHLIYWLAKVSLPMISATNRVNVQEKHNTFVGNILWITEQITYELGDSYDWLTYKCITVQEKGDTMYAWRFIWLTNLWVYNYAGKRRHNVCIYFLQVHAKNHVCLTKPGHWWKLWLLCWKVMRKNKGVLAYHFFMLDQSIIS